jgi:hypothetical protein
MTLSIADKNALHTAAAIIEAGWSRGAAARNAKGDPVRSNAPDAVCFCIAAALYKATKEDEPDNEGAGIVYGRLYDAVTAHLNTKLFLSSWNDRFAEDGAHVARVLRETAQ